MMNLSGAGIGIRGGLIRYDRWGMNSPISYSWMKTAGGSGKNDTNHVGSIPTRTNHF